MFSSLGTEILEPNNESQSCFLFCFVGFLAFSFFPLFLDYRMQDDLLYTEKSFVLS